jgi:hypothetical protein
MWEEEARGGIGWETGLATETGSTKHSWDVQAWGLGVASFPALVLAVGLVGVAKQMGSKELRESRQRWVL